MIKKNITILIINVFVLNIILFNLGLNFNVEGSESEIKTKLTSKFTKDNP